MTSPWEDLGEWFEETVGGEEMARPKVSPHSSEMALSPNENPAATNGTLVLPSGFRALVSSPLHVCGSPMPPEMIERH